MPAGGNINAQQLIQGLLTNPRPGGLPNQSAGPGGQTVGGGIAGIASTADEDGIKVYHDRSNYKEWEFIYDYTKDTGPVGQQGANIGTPASQLGTQPGQQPGQTQSGFGQTSSPFGQPSSGFGQPSSGFGQPSSGFGTPQMPPTTVPRQ